MYTRANANKAKPSSRIITLPGGQFAVAGRTGVYSKAEAEKLAAQLDANNE